MGDGSSFSYNNFAVFVSDPQHADLTWKLRKAIQRNRLAKDETVNSIAKEDSNSSGLDAEKCCDVYTYLYVMYVCVFLYVRMYVCFT